MIKKLGHALIWLVVIAPAAYQIWLLAWTIAHRVGYPYDLEWMEGGLLHHALRIHNGEGIYGPPSIDFIPYLYTPLYPTLLALFGDVVELGYTMGRVVSVVALVGIAGVTAASIASRRHLHANWGPVWAGVVLALGLFAACYPFVEGWYDLVRADTFFLYMVTAGIAGLSRWTTTHKTTGLAGHAKVAAGATLLALAFFCKQTGIFYVGFGGMLVFVLAMRKTLTYAAVAGAVGFGLIWVLNQTTDGWFWIYASKIHRTHDFNPDRFYASFGHILWHFPALTIVVTAGLLMTFATWIKRGKFPAPAFPLVLWASMYAMSTMVGAIGWGTQFAHFNAYLPALLHGSIAAGAAVPAASGCIRLWLSDRPSRSTRWIDTFALLAALAAAVPLSIACYRARWNPHDFMPKASDVEAGDRLIARIHDLPGEVWMPSHPWYLRLAGKTPHVHRMGVKDVTVKEPRPIVGLDDAIANHAFGALVFDNIDLDNDPQPELSHMEGQLRATYRPALTIPDNERPHVYTGARVVPEVIWLPILPAVVPAGARVVFDFESASWNDWAHTGNAWGTGPAGDPLPGMGLVLGSSGRRFATSDHDGDKAVGRVSSPSFPLDGTKLTMRLGGGTDATKLRVELWVDDAIAKVASVPQPGGDALHEVAIDVTELRGKLGHLVLVDDSPVGHLDVDDVWMWASP